MKGNSSRKPKRSSLDDGWRKRENVSGYKWSEGFIAKGATDLLCKIQGWWWGKTGLGIDVFGNVGPLVTWKGSSLVQWWGGKPEQKR